MGCITLATPLHNSKLATTETKLIAAIPHDDAYHGSQVTGA